jgi:hypothetical protein
MGSCSDRPTVHVEWEPPNRTLAKHLQQTGLFHAVPDAEIEDGTWWWTPGKPLCSYRGALRPVPDALIPPEVTCSLCGQQIQRLGLEVAHAPA